MTGEKLSSIQVAISPISRQSFTLLEFMIIWCKIQVIIHKFLQFTVIFFNFSEEQAQVFCKTNPGQRKIVISTNLAETSITIEVSKIDRRFFLQGGRRHKLDCLLHQSLKFYNNVFLFGAYQLLRLLLIWIGWFKKLIVQAFQPIITFYRRGNFVHHHWRCT